MRPRVEHAEEIVILPGEDSTCMANQRMRINPNKDTVLGDDWRRDETMFIFGCGY